MESKKRSTTPQSLGKALKIFDLLAENSSMGVIELSNALNVTRTTIYSILTFLLETNYIEKDSNGKYRLGYKFYDLGLQYKHYFPFTGVAEKYSRELSRKSGLQSNVAIFKAPSTAIMIIMSLTEVNAYQSEVVVYAHVSACGKVLLASLEKNQLDEAIESIDFFPYTPTSITDPEVLIKELSDVKEKGYAFEDGELFSSKGCISAPVYGAGGKVLAAISVNSELSVIKDRFDELKSLVISTASELSRELGYRSNSPA